MSEVYKPWLTAKHWVYEFYAAGGHCLYVGCTGNLPQRLRQHLNKPWWDDVQYIETNVYVGQEAGFAAERERIKTLNPEHNVVLTDRWVSAGGWETRRAHAQERHDRGEMCQAWGMCKQCNAVRRAREKQPA